MNCYARFINLQDNKPNFIMRFLDDKDVFNWFNWFKEYFYEYPQEIILEKLHVVIQNLFNNTDKEHNFKNFFFDILKRKIKESTVGKKCIFTTCMLLSDIEKCFVL